MTRGALRTKGSSETTTIKESEKTSSGEVRRLNPEISG